jgi:SAM-dependent methyltransferase
MEQSLTFNSVAEQYDAFRPAYPPAAFDYLRDVASLLPNSRVLEIGCGTGLATEGLLPLGVEVTAIDPGDEMIAVARRRIAGRGNVAFHVAKFEDFETEAEAYALVLSAQAFHWVPPEIGYAKAADALRSGGVLAIMGHVYGDPPDALMDAFEPHYLQHAPHLWRLPSDSVWYLPGGPFAGWIAASDRYEAPEHAAWPVPDRLSADAFIDRLGTISAYLMLAAEARTALFQGLHGAVSEAGGIDMRRSTHLHWARKR